MRKYNDWNRLTKDQKEALLDTTDWVPEHLGGRTAEMVQLVASLVHKIKVAFPINGVSDKLAAELDVLDDIAKHFENQWHHVIEQTARDYKKVC